MSASAVRGGQVYVEIGADPNKFIAALRAINQRVADMGETLRSAGVGMMAIGAAISGPILAVGGAFVEKTGEMLAMQRALKDVGTAVGEAVAPAFIGLANVIAGAARAVAKFVRENAALVRLAVAIGGYFAAWGAATYALGIALKAVSATIAASIGPLMAFGEMSGKAAIAFAAFASSGPVLAAVGVFAGVAAGAAAAGVNLRKVAADIGGAFANPVQNLKAVFGDLLATVNLTVEGIYRAIAAGDLRGAVDVLWAGWQAGWARGQQAVMNSADPWIAAIQNVFTDMGVGIAAAWDQMWTNIVTSDWGGYLLGAFDNVLNGMAAYWDNLIGFLQKAWARFSAWWSGDVAAMEKEIERINVKNAANAAERDRLRPGFAGRTGLTDEQKAKMQQESADRRAAMAADAERTKQARAARNAANIDARAKAVDQANQNLRNQVNRFPVPPPVNIPTTLKVQSVGTFSAFGLGQMGPQTIQKEQLAELKRIREELIRGNAAGGIGP